MGWNGGSSNTHVNVSFFFVCFKQTVTTFLLQMCLIFKCKIRFLFSYSLYNETFFFGFVSSFDFQVLLGLSSIDWIIWRCINGTLFYFNFIHEYSSIWLQNFLWNLFFKIIVLLYLPGDLVKSNLRGFINPLVNKELKQKWELVDRSNTSSIIIGSCIFSKIICKF